jgi:hypothetical protein
MSTGTGRVKWSERNSPSKPSSSTSALILFHKGHVRPNIPSTEIDTATIS